MPHPRHAGRATVVAIGAACTGAVMLLGAGASVGGLPANDAVARLSGRWAGQGMVTLARGPAESFKCVVTYFPTPDAQRVQQNLRCSNESYKLDAATDLAFAGSKVTGRWQDKIHNLDGDVTGNLTADGFNILLAGRFFQATMDVTGDACAQSVKVAPMRGADNIREISAALRKC